MPITPIYGLPYQAITDIPQGAALGRDLATGVEAHLARIDDEVPGKFQLAQIASVSLLINPVANVITSAAVSWGKTLSGTVRAICCAESAVPGTVVETTLSSVSTTGATVYILRSTSTATTVHVLAVAGL